MQLFAKRFWGFDPAAWPLIAFGLEGNRDALLRQAKAGDCIVFVGTQNEPTEPDEQGRLLGIAEIGRKPLDTLDVLKREDLGPHNFNADGSIRWPKALPMLRAWRFFDPRPYLNDVLKHQLTYEATTRAVLLDQVDTAAVLALPREERAVSQASKVIAQQNLSNSLRGRGPTTGPEPSNWSGNVSQTASTSATTYVLRFGMHDVWKVGYANNPIRRTSDINTHVPSEVLNANWHIEYRHEWEAANLAYDMEQRLLKLLAHKRTVGERVQCSKAEIERAWLDALTGDRA